MMIVMMDHKQRKNMTKSHQRFFPTYRVAIIIITNITMITVTINISLTTSVGLPARSQASNSTHSTGVNLATVCSMTDTKKYK